MNKCCDLVVAARGLAQGAAGGMGGARVQRAGLAGGIRYGFAGPCAPQAQVDRINILLGLEHGSVMVVEPPQPGVVNLRVAEFGEPRVTLQEPSFSCI